MEQHIEIVKTEIKQKGNLESIQRRIFDTLPKEMTHAVKNKCHYKNKCVVNEDIRINILLTLSIIVSTPVVHMRSLYKNTS